MSKPRKALVLARNGTSVGQAETAHELWAEGGGQAGGLAAPITGGGLHFSEHGEIFPVFQGHTCHRGRALERRSKTAIRSGGKVDAGGQGNLA